MQNHHFHLRYAANQAIKSARALAGVIAVLSLAIASPMAFSAPMSAEMNILGTDSARAKPALAQKLQDNKSGFFQHESLYAYAQDSQVTQLWFCHSTTKLGVQCVAAPVVVTATWVQEKVALANNQPPPNKREISWAAERIAAPAPPHHSLGIQSNMLVMNK
jgi:hypothetical protein